MGINAHDINTNTSAKIMSELILVQNNHFSKVCTIFCLFKIYIYLFFVKKIYCH